MRDPELVARARYAATRLEQAWERWRTVHGLAGSADPLASYVGYSLREPMGQPRVVIGVDAAEAERFADFLENHACGVQAQVPAQPGLLSVNGTARPAAAAIAPAPRDRAPEPDGRMMDSAGRATADSRASAERVVPASGEHAIPISGERVVPAGAEQAMPGSAERTVLGTTDRAVRGAATERPGAERPERGAAERGAAERGTAERAVRGRMDRGGLDRGGPERGGAGHAGTGHADTSHSHAGTNHDDAGRVVAGSTTPHEAPTAHAFHQAPVAQPLASPVPPAPPMPPGPPQDGPDVIAAELAGWASGELPGQASEQLAAWAADAAASGRQLPQLFRAFTALVQLCIRYAGQAVNCEGQALLP